MGAEMRTFLRICEEIGWPEREGPAEAFVRIASSVGRTVVEGRRSAMVALSSTEDLHVGDGLLFGSGLRGRVVAIMDGSEIALSAPITTFAGELVRRA